MGLYYYIEGVILIVAQRRVFLDARARLRFEPGTYPGTGRSLSYARLSYLVYPHPQ